MKNLLLSLVMLFSITMQGQLADQLRGVWSSENTSYYVVILHDGAKFNFTNFSFAENKSLKETVLVEKEDYIKTKIFNPSNNWEVFITYKVVDENTISCTFEGSTNHTSYYKRYWLMTN